MVDESLVEERESRSVRTQLGMMLRNDAVLGIVFGSLVLADPGILVTIYVSKGMAWYIFIHTRFMHPRSRNR